MVASGVLGDAVDAAAAGEELAGVHADDLAAGVGPGEHGQGLVVVLVVEGAGDHAAVGDQVVQVAVVHPPLRVAQRGRGRHADGAQRVAGGVCRGGEEPAELDAERMVRVLCVALVVVEHDPGLGERGDDVDVAARAELAVVAGQSAGQPDDLRDPQQAGELRLDVGLRGGGVALRVELDGFGGQGRAGPVDVEAPALVDERRGEQWCFGEPGDGAADVAVAPPAGPLLLAPSVEDPVDGGHVAGVVMDEGGADVAHPGIVEGEFDDVDGSAEMALGGLPGGRVDHHGDRGEAGHGAGDVGPAGAGGLGVGLGVAQRVAGGGEGHPDAVLCRRLGGHREGHLRTPARRGPAGRKCPGPVRPRRRAGYPGRGR